MNAKDLRAYLKDNILLFDGAMGTLCAEKLKSSIGTPCEMLNITNQKDITDIHKEYILSGAKAIKTNTFSANRANFGEETCKSVIEKGYLAASLAAGENAFVFADIGPISVTDNKDLLSHYIFVVDCFLNCGADCFLFETNSSIGVLPQICDYIKEKNKNAFIILSFAFLPDGFTRTGQSVKSIMERAKTCRADAVGFNCASGARHTARLVSELDLSGVCFSAMPNAGYPTVLGNRTYYDGSPTYFAEQIAAMAQSGVKILGGCCGTTPAHIAECARTIKKNDPTEKVKEAAPIKRVIKQNKFWLELCDSTKRPIAVELDPPENSDISGFIESAKMLYENGADVITVADCPIGRPRMDSSLLACLLHREQGIEALPHITCRDRNMNAIKALLLGLCAEGVHNVLTVTGDPIPSGSRDEVKSVYNFNSRMLASFISELNEKSLATPFNIFAALNINAVNFDVQLKIAKQKEQNGVCAFLTQPVLSEKAFLNLERAKRELKGKILGGIFPIVSYKNACFMDSEVAGVKVERKIIDMYKDLDRQGAEELAFKISADIAKKIHPFVDGYYLMTPFSRTGLIARIMEEIKNI